MADNSMVQIATRASMERAEAKLEEVELANERLKLANDRLELALERFIRQSRWLRLVNAATIVISLAAISISVFGAK